MKDLSRFAGFPLEFDPDNMDVRTNADYHLTSTIRTGSDLKDVLRFPQAIRPDEEIYRMLHLDPKKRMEQALLEADALIYSLVLLPAMIIGGELVKTAGHYHSYFEGTKYGYPEVYTQLDGSLLLYLQKKDVEDTEKVLDCVLFEMNPGDTITIPPNYAHILINASDRPGLMAGLYSSQFTAEYHLTRGKKGLAYYFMKESGGFCIDRNPEYRRIPGLRILTQLEGTIFEPPHFSRPLWSAYLEEPHQYQFLANRNGFLKWQEEKGGA